MYTRAHVVAVVALAAVALSSACSDATLPSPRSTVPSVTPPAEMPAFPALARPGVAYVGASDLYAVLGFGRQLESRYVLFDDGTFELQFIGVAESFAYKG